MERFMWTVGALAVGLVIAWRAIAAGFWEVGVALAIVNVIGYAEGRIRQVKTN